MRLSVILAAAFALMLVACSGERRLAGSSGSSLPPELAAAPTNAKLLPIMRNLNQANQDIRLP